MCHWLFWSAIKERNYRCVTRLGLTLLACDTVTAFKVAGRLSFAAARKALRMGQPKQAPSTNRRLFLAETAMPNGSAEVGA